jgi:hypothetical protein
MAVKMEGVSAAVVIHNCYVDDCAEGKDVRIDVLTVNEGVIDEGRWRTESGV